DVTSGKLLAGPPTRQGPPGQAVQAALFSPGGDGLLTLDGSGMLQVWDTTTAEPLQRPFSLRGSAGPPVSRVDVKLSFPLRSAGGGPMAWSPDGRLILAGNPMRVWDTAGVPLTPPLRAPKS